jgi:lysophospholipase L1-like esterase
VSGDSRAEDYKAKADVYADSPWVHEYRKEFHESNVMRWTPYVYWRRQPYRGDHINIDSHGVRLSWAPGTTGQAAGDLPRIFMFGGSTVWGAGVRDAFTIPSILAKELAKRGADSSITNFGEAGYVSTQEVVALLLELQKGNIPDIVIFYDGFNDTYSAFQQRVAGLPLNEPNRVKEFNLSAKERLEQLRAGVLRDMVNDLSTIRFARGLAQRLGMGGEVESSAEQASNVGSAPESLTREVLAIYRSNIHFVTALAKHYRFHCLFYWQPTIFEKAYLTEYEESERHKLRAAERFFHETYDAVRRSDLARGDEDPFHDLSLMLSDVRDPLYVDWCHLGESGNERIARRMAADVASIFAGKP